MVLQILADAAQILNDLDAEILQTCTIADAGTIRAVEAS
ncbi:hypothetical protein QFZ98_008321 [Paraburkholderia youngii]